MRLVSQKPPNEKNTLMRPSASASPIGGALALGTPAVTKCDQLPAPVVSASTTTPASVHSFSAVRKPNTRAPNVRPAMLRTATIQMVPIAIHRSNPAPAGQSTTTYCEAPTASAAVKPGSMMRSDCQP